MIQRKVFKRHGIATTSGVRSSDLSSITTAASYGVMAVGRRGISVLLVRHSRLRDWITTDLNVFAVVDESVE